MDINWGFHKWWYPNSWMVYFMENPIQMDDNWEYPHGLETSKWKFSSLENNAGGLIKQHPGFWG
jgi:hypothetical protein